MGEVEVWVGLGRRCFDGVATQRGCVAQSRRHVISGLVLIVGIA